jgi:arylsulfatase A-like enzyme
MVEELDDAVGRLRAALEKAGVLDRTLIIFTSDNGGAQHITYDGIGVTENAPLSGGKAMLREGGVRVPMIVRWPGGGVRAGAVSDRLAASVDLMPTVLEAAGVPVPKDIDGVSLLPLLRDDTAVRERVFWHFPHALRTIGKTAPTGPGHRSTLHQSPACGVRVGPLKLIRSFHAVAPGQHLHELFDVVADPSEQSDLAATRPDDVARLSAILDADLAATGALIPTPNPAYAPGGVPEPEDKP